eukprot:UN11540
MGPQRKGAQSREFGLRGGFNAVFKPGSLWPQGAKLGGLKTKAKEVQRLRGFLIILKNQGEKFGQ